MIEAQGLKDRVSGAQEEKRLFFHIHNRDRKKVGGTRRQETSPRPVLRAVEGGGSETWPVWLRTLVGVPLWGLWFEITANMRGGSAARMLLQRERRIDRGKQRARKRMLRPERLPDAVADQMVIGVPIEGDDEHA